MKSRFFLILFGFLLVAGFVAQPALAEPTELVILHVNDWDKLDGTDDAGGAGRIVATIARERSAAIADGAETLTTFGGDMLSPSLLSSFDKGAHMVELANRIGFDAAVLGNHEFDFGARTLAARIKEATFPWLASNIFNKGEPGFPGAKRMMVLERGGYKIGLIGITTVETPSISSPGPALTFEDPITIATEMVAKMKADGVDIVIALTHQDLSKDRALLAAVGDIDVIVGGHDHLGLAFYDGRQAILKAASQGVVVGRLKLMIDRVDGRGGPKVVWRPDFALIDTKGIARDPATAAIVDQDLAALDGELNKPIGKAQVEIDSRRASVRSQETVLGNLITDAMRIATESDIAVTNGGGIRGDTVYPAGTELTRRTILTELPFGNRTLKLRVTGGIVRAMLEHSVSGVEDGAGRFLQVSGIRFSFDPKQPVGSRVGDVTVGGKPLDENARYTLAVNDFNGAGGDGFSMLAEATRVIDAASARLMTSQVIAAIEAKGGVSGTVDGRIKRVE